MRKQLINTKELRKDLGFFHKRVGNKGFLIVERKAAIIAEHANKILAETGRRDAVVSVKPDMQQKSVDVIADFQGAKYLEFGAAGRNGVKFFSRSMQKIFHESFHGKLTQS